MSVSSSYFLLLCRTNANWWPKSAIFLWSQMFPNYVKSDVVTQQSQDKSLLMLYMLNLWFFWRILVVRWMHTISTPQGTGSTPAYWQLLFTRRINTFILDMNQEKWNTTSAPALYCIQLSKEVKKVKVFGKIWMCSRSQKTSVAV